MPDNTAEELEGNTLSVYSYIVHVNKPVGVREVTRDLIFEEEDEWEETEDEELVDEGLE